MRLPLCGFGLSLAILLTGCSTIPVSNFEGQNPSLDPIAFFSARTRSTGVVETRGGNPMRRVTTRTEGRWEGATLRLEQDLSFSDGEKQHRSWKIWKLDAHHFEASANDMVGTGRGEAYGNAFRWTLVIALSPGNPLENVSMTQWMYLQPDGRTLLNHTTIRKFGVVVAQVSEQFTRAPH